MINLDDDYFDAQNGSLDYRIFVSLTRNKKL